MTTVATSPLSSKTRGWSLERRQASFALVLVLPAIVMILLFIGYPIVYSFLLTFSNFTIRQVEWFGAGLSNYERVLSDRAFASSLQFTLIYTFTYVPLSMLLGMLVAVLLQQIRIGTTLFRSVLFLPTVIPITMGLLMFQWVLDPNNGVLNHLLESVGLSNVTRNWLADRDTVFGTLVSVTLWGFGPWILLLAGLLSIPKDYYEASRVDGTTHWQEFLFITLPLMRNTMLVVTTLQIIKALKIFVPIYMLTSGNPAGKTQSLYYLVFLKVNQGQNWYAYASTVGWVFTFIIIVISVATILIMRTRKG
jgi:multiple sugar transport system permease protein